MPRWNLLGFDSLAASERWAMAALDSAALMLIVLALLLILGCGSAVLAAPLAGAERVRRDHEVADADAQTRAEALLAEFLSEEEQARMQRCRYLEVPSRLYAGRVYRVPVRHSPVQVYQNGRLFQVLCIGPVVALPDADIILAHKLMIECCEAEYVARANRLLRPPVLRDW